MFSLRHLNSTDVLYADSTRLENFQGLHLDSSHESPRLERL